ncbi:MAG: GNAT family N-acetyltransferase [Pseudomonadota bacterium]
MLAELVNYAGEGMPHYFWTQMATDGQDPWEVGRARQAAKTQDDSAQIVVFDHGAGAVAGLTGYPIPPVPSPIDDDIPPIIRPLQELENLAPSTWYVNVLAAKPADRGKGAGSRLLALAEDIAAAEGLSEMSIIVADNNTGARRLYERIGYREKASRPMVKADWQSDGTAWVLLTKPLG